MLKTILIILGVGALLTVISYFMFVNNVDINEFGVSFDMSTGEIEIQKKAGWYVTKPWVQVSYINTLPKVIKIPSKAKIILSKVVMFDIKGIDEYIRLQGFCYNLNSDVENILLGYAFSDKKYPFLIVMQDPNMQDIDNLRPVDKK